jgi:hypothetical protein
MLCSGREDVSDVLEEPTASSLWLVIRWMRYDLYRKRHQLMCDQNPKNKVKKNPGSCIQAIMKT